MQFKELTDQEILKELGQRVKKTRLHENIKQADLARMSGLSRTTIQRLEQGVNPGLPSLVAVLRTLDRLDQLEVLLAESEISPVEMVRNKGKERQRVKDKRRKNEGEWTW